MSKFRANFVAALLLTNVCALCSTGASSQNLSVQVFKPGEHKSGYVRIGIDALKAFEIAYSYFKVKKGNHESYDSIFYTVEDNKISIVFLLPPGELDGNAAFKVILDRKSLTVLNTP